MMQRIAALFILAALAASSGWAQDATNPRKLLACYRFDETAATTGLNLPAGVDFSGNGRTGTLLGDAAADNSYYRAAVRFGGAGCMTADGSWSATLGSQLELNALVCPRAAPPASGAVLVARGAMFRLSLTSGLRIRAEIKDQTGAGAPSRGRHQ